MTIHCTLNLIIKYFITQPPRNDKNNKNPLEYQHVQRHFMAEYNLDTTSRSNLKKFTTGSPHGPVAQSRRLLAIQPTSDWDATQ